MKDVTRTPEQAAVDHVWQTEAEVAEPEAELTIKVADGTQVVGPDGVVVPGGKTVTLPERLARTHIAAGYATEVKPKR